MRSGSKKVIDEMRLVCDDEFIKGKGQRGPGKGEIMTDEENRELIRQLGKLAAEAYSGMFDSHQWCDDDTDYSKGCEEVLEVCRIALTDNDFTLSYEEGEAYRAAVAKNLLTCEGHFYDEHTSCIHETAYPGQLPRDARDWDECYLTKEMGYRDLPTE